MLIARATASRLLLCWLVVAARRRRRADDVARDERIDHKLQA